MYCPHCLKFINDPDPEFCPHCGSILKKKKFNLGGGSTISLSPKVVKLSVGLLIFLFLVSMISFGGSEETYSSPSASVSSGSANSSNVIIDNSDITVTYNGCEDAMGVTAFYVYLRVQNKLSEEIIVSVGSADVDGETVQTVMTGSPLRIRPGNSGQTGFIFPTANLSIDSVKDAEKATFKVIIHNSDWDIISESNLVTVDLK